MALPFSETPEKARIRGSLASLRSATSSLWMDHNGSRLNPEIASVISEWTVERLEELIREIREDIELSRASRR